MKKIDEKTGKEGLFSLADLRGIRDDAKSKIKDIDSDCAKDYSKHSLHKIRMKRSSIRCLEATVKKCQEDIENGNYSDYEDNTLF